MHIATKKENVLIVYFKGIQCKTHKDNQAALLDSLEYGSYAFIKMQIMSIRQMVKI